MGGYSFHHQTGQFIPAGAGSHEPIPQAFPPTALFPGLLSTSQTIAWPEGETDAREDAPVRVWPQNTERVVSQNGKIDYYERILPPPDSSNVKPLAHLWLKKIGKFLAQYVLSIEGAETKEWYLESLPPNYGLFIHRKGDKDNPRTDAYLYGPKQTQPFRSPAEFILHAKWLYKRAYEQQVEPCGCTYCSGNPQGPISEKYMGTSPRTLKKAASLEPESTSYAIDEGGSFHN